VDKDGPLLLQLSFRIGTKKKTKLPNMPSVQNYQSAETLYSSVFQRTIIFFIFSSFCERWCRQKKSFNCWRRFWLRNALKKIFLLQHHSSQSKAKKRRIVTLGEAITS
jgi:hypothetical protein